MRRRTRESSHRRESFKCNEGTARRAYVLRHWRDPQTSVSENEAIEGSERTIVVAGRSRCELDHRNVRARRRTRERSVTALAVFRGRDPTAEMTLGSKGNFDMRRRMRESQTQDGRTASAS